jgi:hypothetical protein
MKKIFPTAFLCLSLFTACKKTDTAETDKNPLPADLVLKSVAYGPVKVYGNTAEVTDTTLIAAAKISTGYFIYTFRDATYAPGDYAGISLWGDVNTPTVRNGNTMFSAVKNGDDFVFTAQDSLVIQPPVLGYGYFDSYISEPFLKYAQYTPAANGLVVKRQIMGATGNYSKLTVKGVVIAIVRRDPVTKAWLSKSYNSSYNEFNMNGLQTLGRYDTLITRPFDVVFEKN